MNYTMTFTKEHEEELKRIVNLNKFASKIAQTILSKEDYVCSSKQSDILNEVSEMTFYISKGYSLKYEEEARQRTINNLPSTMRRF